MNNDNKYNYGWILFWIPASVFCALMTYIKEPEYTLPVIFSSIAAAILMAILQILMDKEI